MKNLVAPLLLLPILLLSTLSGCISEKEETLASPPVKNVDPIPVLSAIGTIDTTSYSLNQTTADAFAYEEETITFDASDSYDPDGDIISYEWILDEENTEGTGPVVSHSYKIDDTSASSPSIVQIILTIEDNTGSIIFHTFMLGIITKEVTLYLGVQSLQNQNPKTCTEKVKATFGKLRSPGALNYRLVSPIYLQRCTWNATVYMKKSPFSIITKISMILYNSTGEKIAEAQSPLRLVCIVKEKTISLGGIIDTQVDFDSMELCVYGLSFGEKISILYGGEKASFICFDFT